MRKSELIKIIIEEIENVLIETEKVEERGLDPSSAYCRRNPGDDACNSGGPANNPGPGSSHYDTADDGLGDGVPDWERVKNPSSQKRPPKRRRR